MKKRTLKYSIFTLLTLIFATALYFYFIGSDNDKTLTLQQNTKELGTFKNPEIAYEECQKILKDLSETINTSLKEKAKR
ncbi:hypothetical protein [Myroides indicus]|uniref:Uncharacterized protein n=1 Tax=Myroides indicus TaxID=1323422 RepID=A0A4R7F2K3_9FLAO|nr:hypothetical protein [Myroides indicus]TDS57262.1 hypothetical protein C8P70_11678 [Myroides indicus]